MRRLSITLATVFAIGATLVACDAPQAVQPSPDGDEVVRYAEQDREMSAAIAAARMTLPQFEARLADGGLASLEPKVKAGLPADDGSLEHIWVAEPRFDEDMVQGRLANEPVYLSGRHLGDVVTFRRDQISDWSYVRDERMYGNYTTRVMLPQLEPAQRDELAAYLSESPTE